MTITILSRRRFRNGLALILMISLSLCGCSATGYGRLTSEKEVTQAFEAYRILPEHRYYYRGTYSRPFAIAGINENYTLDSKLWIQIDPESEDFRTLINRVALQGTGSAAEPWGFRIVDHAGKDVGVWYSAIRAAAVEIDENGRIVNLSPLRTVATGRQR